MGPVQQKCSDCVRQPSSSDKGSGARRFSLALAIVLALLAVWLRVQFVAHAGGLWRDEVNTVNMACEASWGSFRQATHYDSFALFWQAIVRLWAGLGVCAEDRGWRALGFAIGVGQVVALWLGAKAVGAGAPMWSMLLFGWGPAAVSFGSTVRGYGLAALLAMVVLIAVVRFLQEPNPRRWMWLVAASVLAVQTYLPNGVIVVALHAAASVELACRRQWQGVAALAASSGVAASSLVLNAEWIRYALQVSGVEQRRVSWSDVWYQWWWAAAPEVWVLKWAWPVAVCFLAAWPFIERAARRTEDSVGRWFFSAAALLTGAGHALYVHSVAQLPGLPWYFLAPTAVVALSVEGVWSRATRQLPALRWLGPVVCGALAVAVFPPVRTAVHFRLTNVDEVASFLSRTAVAQDFILVSPWYAGITFQRYYRGPAPWETIPPLQEHRYHVHLEVRERMREGEEAIRPLLQRAETVLRRGGILWLVGVPPLPEEGEAIPPLKPAASPRTPAGPYLLGWEMRVALFLYEHGARVERIPVGSPEPVSVHESLGLLRLQGWRG